MALQLDAGRPAGRPAELGFTPGTAATMLSERRRRCHCVHRTWPSNAARRHPGCASHAGRQVGAAGCGACLLPPAGPPDGGSPCCPFVSPLHGPSCRRHGLGIGRMQRAPRPITTLAGLPVAIASPTSAAHLHRSAAVAATPPSYVVSVAHQKAGSQPYPRGCNNRAITIAVGAGSAAVTCESASAGPQP